MKVVKGEDLVVLINDKLSLHADEHTLKLSLTTEELSTVHAPNHTYPVKTDWSATANGVVVIDETVENANSPDDLIKIFLAMTEVDVIIKSPLAGVFAVPYKGKGFIESIDVSSKVGEKVTYSLSIKSADSTLTPVQEGPAA